jgi:hypothetical protein
LRTEGGFELFLSMGALVACNHARDTAELRLRLLGASLISTEMLDAADGERGAEDLADFLVRKRAIPGRKMAGVRAEQFRDNLRRCFADGGRAGEFAAQEAVFPANLQLMVDLDAALSDAAAFAVAVSPVLDGEWVADGPAPPDVDADLWRSLAEPSHGAAIIERLGASWADGARRAVALLAEGSLRAPPSRDDYERAARGEFIKSYEVLDKVDLSGMALGGADESSLDPIPALDVDLSSRDAIPAIDREEGDDDAFAIDPASTAPQLAPIEDIDLDVLSPAPAPPDDEEFEIFADDNVPVSEDGIEVPDELAVPDAAVTAFGGDQVREFVDRIGIFNHIFRIIFEVFALHVGDDGARGRFNQLLADNRRQYPELFDGVVIEKDGTLSPPRLVGNLASCPPGDPGALLHQGLYELIFSHLYDAKDLLPGDAETAMMERIVVYERQLHPG